MGDAVWDACKKKAPSFWIRRKGGKNLGHGLLEFIRWALSKTKTAVNVDFYEQK